MTEREIGHILAKLEDIAATLDEHTKILTALRCQRHAVQLAFQWVAIGVIGAGWLVLATWFVEHLRAR